MFCSVSTIPLTSIFLLNVCLIESACQYKLLNIWNRNMSSKGSQGIETWGQVVNTVEATDNSRQQRILDKLRKITYKETLNQQMHEKNKQKGVGMEGKLKEREQINYLAQEENDKERRKKLMKVKTEQWYQMQNRSLMDAHTMKQQEPVRNDVLINRIIDDNDKRKQETRNIFKIQDGLNRRQVQIHKSKKKQEARQSMQDGELYKAYVEREFQKKYTERQLWKNKYLRKGRYSEAEYDDKMAYSSYLDHQVAEKEDRKCRERGKIQQKLRPFNQNIQEPSPSPAYLGKLTQSFDRNLQLSYLDKHIKFKPNQLMARQSQRPINQEINRSMQISKQLPSYRKREASQPQFPKPAQKMQISSSSNDLKTSRQFTSYDFISGTKKTFFI